MEPETKQHEIESAHPPHTTQLQLFSSPFSSTENPSKSIDEAAKEFSKSSTEVQKTAPIEIIDIEEGEIK